MPLVVVDVGAIVVALVALMFLYAFSFMIKNGVGLPLGQIPGVGGAISNGIDAAIGAVQGLIVSMARLSVQVVADFFFATGTLELQLWDMAAGLAEDTAGATEHVITQSIPHALGVTLDYAGQLAREAEARADAFAGRVAQDAADSLHSAVDTINQLRAVDFRALADYTSTATGAVLSETHRVEQEALGAILTTQNYVTQLVGGEIARARDAEAGLMTETRSEIAAVWNDTRGLVTDVGEQLDAKAAARDAAVAATAAVATAAVATDLARWLDDCGDPLCDGLGTLAGLLPQLTRLFSDGLLLAAVGAAIRDPSGSAHLAVEISKPFIDAAVTVIDDIGGL